MDSANEQIKLMRTYRNASGMTKIVFDDETYFQVRHREPIANVYHWLLYSRVVKVHHRKIRWITISPGELHKLR